QQLLADGGVEVDGDAIVLEPDEGSLGPAADEELRQLHEAHPEAGDHWDDVDQQLEDHCGQQDQVREPGAVPAARSGLLRARRPSLGPAGCGDGHGALPQTRIESCAVCMAVRTSSRVTFPPVAMVANMAFIAWPTVDSNWSSHGTSGSGAARSA